MTKDEFTIAVLANPLRLHEKYAMVSVKTKFAILKWKRDVKEINKVHIVKYFLELLEHRDCIVVISLSLTKQ